MNGTLDKAALNELDYGVYYRAANDAIWNVFFISIGAVVILYASWRPLLWSGAAGFFTLMAFNAIAALGTVFSMVRARFTGGKYRLRKWLIAGTIVRVVETAILTGFTWLLVRASL